MTAWPVVIALGMATIVIKAAGPAAMGNWTPPQRAQQVLLLVAPAVLAALVAIQVFSSGQHYHLGTKAVGLGAAADALSLRAPLLVVVVCAVASSALARALFGIPG